MSDSIPQTAPNPIDDAYLYDHILLGGTFSPGVVTITGHDRKINWDVADGPGIDGATTKLKNIPPIEFSCSFYLVRDDSQGVDDWTDWIAFRKIIDSSVQGTKPRALDIYHPDLAANDIKSVCKASVGGVIHDGKGGQTVVVKFQEYRPAKPKKMQTLSSKGQNDPDAAALAELSALTTKNEQTPWSVPSFLK